MYINLVFLWRYTHISGNKHLVKQVNNEHPCQRGNYLPVFYMHHQGFFAF